ncbi:DNA-directed DNA polymerase delta subunit POL31 PWA37_000399 [Arxiozyma heterogenica]|uniref:DNA-directed DNA polymerase n=1 Tax=Arxiozyma heterogenica TaxID=278026 RepID=A0AAN7ZX69_9SACH|nr:hypothetical protein RI543_004012 [Kazachstania heterogenica]
MDSLLQKFNENRKKDPEVTSRVQIDVDFEEKNPFELKWNERDYDSQFFNIYKHRLTVLRGRVESECERKWNNGFQLNGKSVVKKDNVLDVQAGEPCWCIGTIYCEMRYKPNVLEEVINDTYGAPDLVKSYVDPDGSDQIMLEDESGRLLLVGDFIKSTPFITGAVVGLLGMEADPGTFQVLDICYPKGLNQSPMPFPIIKDNINNKYNNIGTEEIILNNTNEKVAIISGLNISSTSPSNLLKVRLLQEYLNGSLQGNIEAMSKISRLIICGNSIEYNNGFDADQGNIVYCLDQFSQFLGNILQTISVDVLPGKNDPSDKSLPQQPLHKALFNDKLKSYFNKENRPILNLVTNPYKFKINGWDILTISGQNIDDIMKYIIPYSKMDDNTNDGDGSDNTENVSESNDNMDIDAGEGDTMEHRLDLMECTMKWQNIVPTCPDTLWCYPYKNKDPFILNEWPHLYVVGNQPDFARRNIKTSNGNQISMLAIPEFSKTGKVVILDLVTLQTEIVQIDL